MDSNPPALEQQAAEIATSVADKCHGNRKPGQAPERYAIIWQAARLGAIAALLSHREGSQHE